MAIHISTPVLNLLQARGLLPKHCKLVEITIPPADGMVIRYEVFVTEDSAAILAEAFAAIAAEQKAINPRPPSG